jgi:hypothetical protein
MLALVSRVRRAFRLSTPRITRLGSSGSLRDCCWSTVIGHTRGTETCEFNVFARVSFSHPFAPSGLSTSFTRTSSVLVFFGGSRSTVAGAHNSTFTALLPFPLLLISEVSVFEYTFLLWWNSFWTVAPAIAIGLFDRIVGMWSCTIVVGLEFIPISR